MALATSGALTLDQIHVEAGGTTGTTCSLNDSDIRGLTAAAGKTINSTLGTTIDFDDFYGAAGSLFSTTVTVGQGGNAYLIYKGYSDGVYSQGGFGSLTNDNSGGSFVSGDTVRAINTIYLTQTNLFFRITRNTVINNSSTNSFTTMTVNGNSFSRSNATFQSQTSGGNVYQGWMWQYVTNPFPSVGSTCSVVFN